jgi:palmitoyltransferase
MPIQVTNGADPHAQGTEGLTALHLALQFKHADVLLYLCACHPSLVDAPTCSEKGSLTPLMYLVQQWGKQMRPGRESSKKYTDLLRALVAFGASVKAAAKGSGDTALHLAMTMKSDLDAGTVLQELLSHGASLDASNASGETPRGLLDRRPRKAALKPQVQREDCGATVPSAAGFWAPWLQIGAGASLTSLLGWLVGCAAFAVACGAMSTVSGATRAAGMRVQHGFAAGSIAFIVASFYVYLYDTVSLSFLVWYVYSVSVLVFFFVKTTISDPGFVRLGSKSDLESADSHSVSPLLADGRPMSTSSSSSSSSPSACLRSLALKGDLHASLICHSCLIEKPPRSKHCSYCGHCVMRFDHHCPFVNTCVGQNNIGYFLGFVLFCALAIGSHLYIALPFIWNACPDAALAASGTVEKLVCSLDATPNDLIVVTGLALVHWIWITLLGLAQCAQQGADITTYESIRGDKATPVTCKRFFRNLGDVARGRPTTNDRDYAQAKHGAHAL